MRAITQHEYGSADVLRVEEVDRPTINVDVLIRVHSAGLDGGTWMARIRTCLRLIGAGLRRPKNPGACQRFRQSGVHPMSTDTRHHRRARGFKVTHGFGRQHRPAAAVDHKRFR